MSTLTNWTDHGGRSEEAPPPGDKCRVSIAGALSIPALSRLAGRMGNDCYWLAMSRDGDARTQNVIADRERKAGTPRTRTEAVEMSRPDKDRERILDPEKDSRSPSQLNFVAVA